MVFGASGIGKTSLLLAGIFPRLREQHVLPVYIRLNVAEQDVPLMDQARFALQVDLQRYEIKAPQPSSTETLWQYLHRSQLQDVDRRRIMPLLVFDQLEELFTHRSCLFGRPA